jgi:preprotein translocase subunit SecE
MLTTIMVFIMATIAAIFFFMVDFVIRNGLEAILALGS